MSFKKLLYHTFLFLFILEIGNAQTITISQSTSKEKKGRPKIGLVLSGGGAKGFAHVGVLKLIDELGIPIDYIGGTSAGALVGGFYAAGYSAEQIEEMVTNFDWDNLITDEVNRDYVPFFEKEEIYRYHISLPIHKKKIDLPESFLAGQNILHLLCDKTLYQHNVTDFSLLPIPFLCIAADLSKGEEVVLKQGYLPMAMRASMAVPAAIGSVEIDGRKLVDGGVINNYPVDRVLEMGADIIIGVDLKNNFRQDSTETVGNVVDQLIGFMGREKYEKNVKNTDIYINPNTNGYSASDFSNRLAKQIIKAGELAAEDVRKQLITLRDSLNIPKRIPAKYPNVDPEERFYIKNIEIEGVSDLHEDYIIGKLEFNKGQWVKYKLITDGIDKIYAGLNYEQVSYRLTGAHEKTLTIRLKESFTRSLNLGAHFDRDNSTSLLINTTMRNISGPGSLLSGDLVLSKLMGGRLRYTLDRGTRPGLEIKFDSRKLNFDFEDENILYGNISGAISRFQLNTHSVFYHSFTFGLGLSMEFFDVKPRIYNPIENNPLMDIGDNNFYNYQVFVKLDTKDDFYFPRKGAALMLNFKLITDDFYQLSGSNPILVSLLKYNYAKSFTSRLSVLPGIYWRLVYGIGDVPPYYTTQLGGQDWADYYDAQIPFYGLKLAELQTTNAIVGRLETRYRMFSNQYVHGFFNFGIMNNDLEFWKDTGTKIVGGGIGYSLNSVFGPATIKILASNYRSSIYTDISLGFWF